jgi:hypothetical protein
LLQALSDDLALPFLQIRSTLELLDVEKFSKKTVPAHAQSMLLNVEAGLQLIEAYRLALRSGNTDNLQLEPVAVGAVLQDVAHQLAPYAAQYSTELEIQVRGRLGPVLAHKPSLVAAMQVLSASLIRAQAAERRQKSYRLVLAAHKSSENGISTGVFSNMNGLSDRTLRSARSLIGRARQPLPQVPSGAASGVLIADMLCAAMWAPLRASAHQGMGGLTTSVPSSKQLNFI